MALIASAPASAHPSSDPLHGGSGQGVTVVGHSDLGGTGLNGHVAVLGNYAYVGSGTNGGFAAEWNKTPTCAARPNTVKVVSLVDPANPTVVSTIDVTGPGEAPGATVGRAVSVIHVNPSTGSTFSGDLLAVALESCRGAGRLGVDFYDVSNPARPTRLGTSTPVIGTATRDVSLVQRPDGRVFALEANQSGTIRLVDVTNPTAPLPMGTGAGSPSNRGCRPYSFAQGVTTNGTGSKAYAAYGDAGLLALDISNPTPGGTLPTLSQTAYGASEEGNSFRFVPNADETAALATDDDLLPAKTTLTIGSGTAAGTYSGCEAIWGGPLYRRADPSLSNRQIVNAGAGAAANYTGLDVRGRLALVNRGSDFVTLAKTAQDAGAAGVLIGNTSSTQSVLSPDASAPGDAGVSIPVVVMPNAAAGPIRDAIAAGNTVTGTLADNPDTWGALRIFDLSGSTPVQTAVFNAPHTRTLTPGDGLYHAVNPLWSGHQALVAWMSDGLRVVDVSDRSAPKAGPFYVPPAVADPTGEYGTVPLVVGVAKSGSRVVISDINSGLYVLDLRSPAAALAGVTAPAAVATTLPQRRRDASLDAALRAEARRQRDLNSCLGGVASHRTLETRRAKRGSARRRARARRHLTRHARSGRERCLRLYGRTPGRITGLRARTLSSTKVELSFNAPGTDGSRPPAARGYLIRQARSAIKDARGFSRALTLCRGSCRASVTTVGATVRFTISNLRPRTTYHYALAARDNVSGRLGPRSPTVTARTR